MLIRKIRRASVLLTALLLSANVHALSTLQLDILGGSYDSLTSTVIGGDTGTLFAYGCMMGNCDGALDLSQSYYISMAIVPKDGIGEDTDFGSFIFDGVTYDYTNTAYGTPPMEIGVVTQLHDPGDLATHDIFETAFGEKQFDFDSITEGVADNTRSSVNTQNTPGTDPLLNPGTNLAYVGFSYDATGLMEGYALHFDLYSAAVKACVRENGSCTTGDVDITDFAPYSKDAETCCTTDLPEPNPAGIALIGLAGIGLLRPWRRRRLRCSSRG